MVTSSVRVARCQRNAARVGHLKPNKPQRIGIYAGTFNPVHSGHIAFALQAMLNTGLDKVYFLPERRPRNKPDVEHFAHRVAMLKQAVKPHPQFEVLELVDVAFTIDRTLPKLRKLADKGQLVFLMGSDIAEQVPAWQNADALLQEAELVVGIRQRDNAARVYKKLFGWKVQPKELHVFTSFAADISSREVREALYQRSSAPGLLASVRQYSNRNWLYISLA